MPEQQTRPGQQKPNFPLNTLVADDHRLFRQGLISLMKARPDLFTVIDEVATGAEAVERCAILHPDLVLMDIFMPVMDGLQAARHILAACPGIRIIMLTASLSKVHLEEAMSLGVAGFLPKSLDADELFDMVIGTTQGEVALTHAAALQLMKRHGTRREDEGSISCREHQVLLMAAKGMSNQQISEQLFISVNTVKAHIKNIFGKLNVSNRTQLAAYAMQEGLISEAASAAKR